MKNSPILGQRVLMTGQGGRKEIGTVVISPTGETHFGAWVFLPSLGYASDYALHNIESLPNGQL